MVLAFSSSFWTNFEDELEVSEKDLVPELGKHSEKCGFRDTGEVNWLSKLYRGDERPVKVMRLDYTI